MDDTPAVLNYIQNVAISYKWDYRVLFLQLLIKRFYRGETLQLCNITIEDHPTLRKPFSIGVFTIILIPYRQINNVLNINCPFSAIPYTSVGFVINILNSSAGILYSDATAAREMIERFFSFSLLSVTYKY